MRQAVIVAFLSFLLCGVDLSNSSVPRSEIRAGGPPKDGIPALTDPNLLLSSEQNYLHGSDRVLGVVIAGKSRAYPIRILNWHEIVNDTLEGVPFVVTYCPLCGTGMVFKASSNSGTRDFFGVSGLLYNSDVLLYDKRSDSLWSQIRMEAIAGKRKGETLSLLPATHTTWKDWSTRHPETSVLSLNTGYQRDYSRDPYSGYEKSRRLYFPVAHQDERFHPKDWIAGIKIGNAAKAYPFKELEKLSSATNTTNGRFKDIVGGTRLSITYDLKNRTITAHDGSRKEVPNTQSYWFAWAAFHPNTAVFKAESLTEEAIRK